MGIFKKKKSSLQIRRYLDKDGITNVISADVSNVGDQWEKEDLAVALIIPTLEGKMHLTNLPLWIAIALKVKYVTYAIAEDTYLNHVRNKLIDRANEICVKHFNRLPDYYLFIDEDNVVQPNLFDELRSKNKDIVSADYIRKEGWIPVWTPVEYYTKWNGKWKFKRGDLVEAITIGAGALLVKGEVLRKIKPPWFKVVSDAKTFLGEDAYFCQLCRDNGYKVWVATDIVVGHMGVTIFPSDWENQGRKIRDSEKKWEV